MSMIDVSPRSSIVLNHQPMEAPRLREAGSDTIVDGDGLSLYELEKFLLDIRDEPSWRVTANKCADYYDHNQLSDEVLADMKMRGLPTLVIDLIHPTINTVLGMEAKTRTDWKVDWEDEANEQVAQAIGKKLKAAQRETSADRAMSNAYAGQIKAGLHWVEVGLQSDPFRGRYRVNDVHRREIWWDWRRRDINDWRYLIRRQRFDVDQLILSFPQMKDILTSTVNGQLTWQDYANRLDEVTSLGQFIDIERALTIEEQDWIDFMRKQVSVFEVWYRRYVRGLVARIPNTGVVIEIDQENPRHMLAIAGGAIKPVMATYPKLRQSLFVGPYRVFDRPTPLPHRKIPYVPFFGYREDLTGVPYGLIRGMLSPQDEINARRSKSLSLLNSRHAEVDDDALDQTYNTHLDVAEEISRPDYYVVLNSKRKNQQGVRIESNQDLAAGQQEILQESKNEIHETSGVFPPMAGDQQGGLSGLAINSLVEQGTQTLAEINDNYAWGRREVGDQLTDLIKADSLHEHDEVVGEGRQKKTITLNGRTRNQSTGQDEITNQVANAALKLVLEDVPATPAWRQQQSQQLAEITKSLPPQMQAFVVPFYLEATDLPKRKEIAAILRKQLGLPDTDTADGQEEDPQVTQLKQQLQQMQQQGQEQVQQLTEQAQKAMQENASLKLQMQDKSAKNVIAAKDADTREKAVDNKAALDTMNVLATVERSEYPKGGGAENASAIQGALEELIATVRQSHGEIANRLDALEKAAPTAPAAP